MRIFFHVDNEPLMMIKMLFKNVTVTVLNSIMNTVKPLKMQAWSSQAFHQITA